MQNACAYYLALQREHFSQTLLLCHVVYVSMAYCSEIGSLLDIPKSRPPQWFTVYKRERERDFVTNAHKYATCNMPHRLRQKQQRVARDNVQEVGV